MPDDKRTMLLKFRRDHTVAGRLYKAGKTEAVEVTDEAWKAVNVGAADLDPPPGVGGQPAPEDIPDWVTQEEAASPHATPAAAPAKKTKGMIHPPETHHAK